MESEPDPRMVSLRRKQGIRTYALLVLGMAVVTLIVTSLCVLIIRNRWRAQVTEDLSQDLEHSVTAFQNLQAERLGSLERENALLAELPTLKALMTSGDDLTIRDGAVDFWQISGTDLFALADPRDRIVAAYTKNGTAGSTLEDGLKNLLHSSGKHYLIDGKSLYACSLRPLYFGSDGDGTLLGYVISGVSIERTVRLISQPTGVEATFLSSGKIVASTLTPSLQSSFAAQFSSHSVNPGTPATVEPRRYPLSGCHGGSFHYGLLSAAIDGSEIPGAGGAVNQPHQSNGLERRPPGVIVRHGLDDHAFTPCNTPS